LTRLAASQWRYLWFSLAGFVLFALIGLAVACGVSDPLDREIFLAAAEWFRTHPWLMTFLAAMSYVAEAIFRIVGAALIILALLVARRRRAALFVFVVVAGGMVLCSGIKAIVARARPELLPQLDLVHSYSFPSSHAWNGLVFYGQAALIATIFLERRWRAPVVAFGILLALITGFSRIALSVHWPSDVLAGWIGGASWLMLCYVWWEPAMEGKQNLPGC